MSCFNNSCYLPQPARAWSRVQNSCSLTTNIDNNGLVKIPYSNQLVPASALGLKMAMLNKGNVLQYKANSSNLTKSQRYSKIAKGQWTNRNTTWATQSTRGYTNPNTTSLKRSGNVVNIAIDPVTGAVIGPTTAPVTCPQPVIPVNPVLPSNGGGGSDVDDPQIPPPVVPTPGSDVFPVIIPDTPVEPIVIQDEGNLICSVQENVCTGETKTTLSQQLCNPTTDSDVPGQIQDLCWNDGTPTWYPRQRYIMTNSDNKWPVNAELSSSIKPYAPVLISVTSNFNVITLNWSQNEACVYVSEFDIFQDGVLIKSVNGLLFTTDVIVPNCNYYQYFIVGGTTGNVVSDPSNTVGINIAYIEPPNNLSFNTPASNTIQLTWSEPLSTPCVPAVSYNIYDNSGTFLNNTTNLYYTPSSSLTNCSTYTYLLSSLDASNNESLKTTIIVTVLWPTPPSSLSSSVTGSGQIKLTWSKPSPSCDPKASYNIYNSSGTYIGNTKNLYYTVNNLTNCSTYDFYVSTLYSNGNESGASPITSIQVLWPGPPANLSYLTTGTGQVTLSWLPPATTCVSISGYKIYNSSGTLIGNTISTILHFVISGLANCSTYTYYVSAVDSFSHESIHSPVVVNPSYPNPPTNLSYLVIGSGIVELTWVTPTTSPCITVGSYNIYENNALISTVNAPDLTTTITGLAVCNIYTYNITSVAPNGNESAQSDALTFTLLWPGPPVGLACVVTSTLSLLSAGVQLSWSAPIINTCTNTIITYNVYFNGQFQENVSSTTYLFPVIQLFDSNVYSVQSSALITGITQTSHIINKVYIALPFIVTGNPHVTISNTTEIIVKYDDPTGSIKFWIPPDNPINYLVGGGGGAGGAGWGLGNTDTPGNVYSGGGGGGGGGAITTGLFSPDDQTTYDIVVGAGGGPGTYLYSGTSTPQIYAGGQPSYPWGNGYPSSFDSNVANGGYSGQGEVYTDGTTNYNRTSAPAGGLSGGGLSGGGQGCLSNYSTGYQNPSVGTNGTTFTPYDSSFTFGGGGGGGNANNKTAKSGGQGGGGSGGCGGDPAVTASKAGTANTGGGGGGGGCLGSNDTTTYYSTLGTEATRQGGSGTVVLYFDYN